MNETLGAGALDILRDWVKSESLRKHCYAVADSMKHFAQLRGENADLWEAVGLLHDMDYERHPNLEQSRTGGHPFVGVAWLRDNGWSEERLKATSTATRSLAGLLDIEAVTPFDQDNSVLGPAPPRAAVR